MKKVRILLLILCIISVFNNTAFCDDDIIIWTWVTETWTTQSIKELQNTINELNRSKNSLNLEFLLLNQNQKLKDFFIDDLSKDELKEIEVIIEDYLIIKNKIERNIEENSNEWLSNEENRKKLLTEKKEFYINLLPFIKKYMVEEYLEYIEQDVKILKEKWDLSEEMTIKSEIINSKLETIEEKILEHREYLNDKFNILINNLIDEKIKNLISNEKFLILTTQEKILVIDKILEKINLTIENLELKTDKTDALIKKLDIYKKVYLKLEELKKNL